MLNKPPYFILCEDDQEKLFEPLQREDIKGTSVPDGGNHAEVPMVCTEQMMWFKTEKQNKTKPQNSRGLFLNHCI